MQYYQTVDFDAGQLPTGIYLYTLRINGMAQTRSMMLIK